MLNDSPTGEQKVKLPLPLTQYSVLRSTDRPANYHLTFFSSRTHAGRSNVLWKITSGPSRSRIADRLGNLFQHPALRTRWEMRMKEGKKKKRFRSSRARPSSRKRRNVTVFRHGVPGYRGSTLPAPVTTLTPDGAFSHSLRPDVGVRRRIACPRDAVDADDRRVNAMCVTRNAQDEFCNRVCGFDSTVYYTFITHALRTLRTNATSSHMSKWQAPGEFFL